MEVLTILLTGVICCICFLIGAKVGQKVNKGEDIKMPSVNPIKAIKEHKENKQAEMEQNKLETIMRNIERYDGTSRGQEDVG